MEKIIKRPCGSMIPVQVNKKTFEEFFLPHLPTRKRGPDFKIGAFKVFNYILRVLYTGIQWKCLEIGKDSEGRPEIHYTSIYKAFSKWSSFGAFKNIFNHSVVNLSENEIQERHLSFKLLAYTLINIREFCIWSICEGKNLQQFHSK